MKRTLYILVTALFFFAVQIQTKAQEQTVVGTIPGSFNVGTTGAATYTIPIECPVGINGMQPNISVGYNSQAGYGTLGTGWNISGISAITRGGKNLYFDSNTEGVKFDNSDALYLDGQRLVKLSGTEFTAGAEYATEVEDFTRVKIITNSVNEIYFQVTTQDGKIFEFGNTEDSKIESIYKNNGVTQYNTLSWKINKAFDTYGNSIKYSYINSSSIRGQGDNKQISEIEYAGKTIEFNYNPNKTYSHNYRVMSVSLVQLDLLASITTKVGTTTIKKYQFDYNNQDKLQEVKLTDGNNFAINSSIINWSNTTGQPEFNSIGNVANSNLSTYPKGTSSVDFVDINGDGYNDRVERWTGQKVGNNTTNGFINVYFFNNTTKTYSTTISTLQVLTYCDYEKYKPQFLFVDINNDGKEDIIYTDNDNLHILSYQNGNLLPFFSDGRGVYDTEQFIKADKDNIVKITAKDVNHDGYADIVFGYYNRGIFDNGERGYAIFFGSQIGLTVNPSSGNINPNYTLDYFDFGDFFDADGKLDMLCIPSKNGLVQPTLGLYPIINTNNNYIQLTTNSNTDLSDFYALKPSDFKVIDLDNDGLSDFLFLSSTNHKWRFIKNSHGSISYNPISDNFTTLPFEGDDCQFIDINGDGLIDVVNYEHIFDNPVYTPAYGGIAVAMSRKYNHTEWSVYINKGNGNFFPPQKINFNTYKNTFTYVMIGYVSDGNTVYYPYNEAEYNNFSRMLFTISDINGDGINDLIISQASNNYALSMPQANHQNLVTSVTNGMGLTESVSYKNFSEYEPFNANELNAKIRPLRVPLLVADTHMHIDGSKTVYSFDAPKYHTEGKGFLGFAVLKTSNVDNNVKTTSYYEFDQTYFFPALSSQSISTIGGDNDISYSSQTNRVKVISSALKRYIPYASIQNNTDALKGLHQITTTNYDDYPSSLTQTTVTGDLTTSTVTTFTGPENKTPYLPASVVSIRTQAGQSFTKQTNYAFTYDSTHPYKITEKTETVDPGDVNSVATTYSDFDPWGHPQNISINANGKTRESTVKYYKTSPTEANAGLYLRSRSNVLNETTNYNWNETTGLLDSESDPRGNTTTYKYSSFGQLNETVYPDGIQKATTLQWAVSGAVSGAKYYSYSETTGHAPVTVWYDVLGRAIQSESYGLNEKKISVSTEYYAENYFATGKRKGMVYRTSEPYFEADASNKVWAKTLTYDKFGRIVKAIIPMGELSNQYNGQTTTVKTPESTTITTLNSAGQVLTSNVNGKTVTFDYYPSGLVKTSTPQNGSPITMEYNKQGRQTRLVDPNSGLIRSEYNGFGELTLRVQRVHLAGDSIRTIHNYKTDGRLESINRNNEITSYTYITTTNYQNRIDAIELKNTINQVQNRQTFTYDPVSYADRVSELKEEIVDNNGNLKAFVKKYEYDIFGRIKKEVFPSGNYLENEFDRYSNLIETKDATGRQIWKATAENARGQLTEAKKGGRSISYGFDDRGLPNSIQSTGIISLWYTFKEDGNLWAKEDYVTEQGENYKYDELNRLTNWDVYIKNDLIKQNSISYDPTNGTIQTKSDIGNFELIYGENDKPHALTSISGVPTNFPQSTTAYPLADLTVTYTDFKKIKTLNEMGKSYELTYGVDNQRRKSVYVENGQTRLTRYYLGNYEEEVDAAGNTKKIHYLSGAILIQNNGVDSLLYTYSDYQGSLIALTDASGNVVERYAYDPWGARRNPTDWTQKDIRTQWIVNRGYTGHEHLDAFGIINMNGRVYDPLTAEFFSPDPILTDAGYWLDYNRFGYCLNNPFRYTDPSGYTWWAENGGMVITTAASIVVGGVVTIATAGAGVPAMIQSGIAAGAAGGFTGGVVGTAVAGGSFSVAMNAGFHGAAMGAMMGGITAGIGSAFGTAGSIAKNTFNVWNELGRAGAHALAQGGFSAMRGGDFWQGAAAGFASSFAGSASQGVGVHGWGMVGVSAFSGGVGAAIAGGKAEEILFGVVQGAMVGVLNHLGNELQEKMLWEQKQVQRIYDLLVSKDNLTYADIVNEIGTKYEQTFNLSGKVIIQGEKVRFCVTIDVSKNHLDKNLQWYREVTHNYGVQGVAHDSYSQTVLRQGRWNIDYYSIWRSDTNIANPIQPFIISYPQKFQSIINFK